MKTKHRKNKKILKMVGLITIIVIIASFGARSYYIWSDTDLSLRSLALSIRECLGEFMICCGYFLFILIIALAILYDKGEKRLTAQNREYAHHDQWIIL